MKEGRGEERKGKVLWKHSNRANQRIKNRVKRKGPNRRGERSSVSKNFSRLKEGGRGKTTG